MPAESEPLDLAARWCDLCYRIGAKGNKAYHLKLFGQLIYHYCAPDRHYHNLDHIRTCLIELDKIRHLISGQGRCDNVELAIWFHDAVYEVWAEDNEARSASMAIFFIHHLMELPPEVASKVAYLIENTAYFTKGMKYEVFDDGKYLVDIDLYVGMGGVPYTFRANSILIDMEWDWADPVERKKSKLKVFQMFEKRRPFFLTGYYWERYENQVRTNLASAIKELETELSNEAASSKQIPS